ncbi:MAG: phenylalanine--tRNA ligase subunit beta [Candidatus Binatia bacterium]
MKLPLGWLRDYLEELPSVDDLAHRLTMAGLEVEAVVESDPRLVDHLRVARIAEMVPHPNADRLSLCRVEDGEGERQIVCGAKNMKAGDHVVLAEPGAVLPGGLKIKKSKIRGEVSGGMLCSAAELGVADDHSGILILDETVEPGTAAAALFGLDQPVLEIGITPNRGDCLSVRGLAREVAAVCGVQLSDRFDREYPAPGAPSRFDVRIDSSEACALYTGIEIVGVKIGPSPMHVAGRLAAAGVRAINNVVDVTNLILLELGQPLHAFDSELLSGTTIGVRTVGEATEIETLDQERRELLAGDLAIWDDVGPIAIAGVMGGARTAVNDGTTRMFLESAWFRPGNVRVTSRRLGLISESSYRFERRVDPAGVERALLAAAELIVELAGGRIEGGVARGGEGVPAPTPVPLRVSRIKTLLGVDVDLGEAARILERLGASVTRDGDALVVTPPTHRSDLTREVDLVEEVARVRGYDSIPEQVPLRAMQPTTAPPVRVLHGRMREQLSACGLIETVGLAFCATDRNEMFPGLHRPGSSAVIVRNPLNVDASEMRKSVLPCLVEAHALNARSGVEATDFFSIGRTFSAAAPSSSGTLSEELEVVGGLLWGPRRGRAPGPSGSATVWDAKAYVERLAAMTGASKALALEPAAEDRSEYHPRSCALVKLGEEVIGLLGMIHPDLAERLEISHEISIFEVDTRKLLEYAPSRSVLQPIPRYPSSSRDVSLLVPDQTLAGEVIAQVGSLEEPLIENVFVFDEYKGTGIPPGVRALAFQIVYRSPDGTLTDEDVTSLHERVIAHLINSLGVEVRV